MIDYCHFDTHTAPFMLLSFKKKEGKTKTAPSHLNVNANIEIGNDSATFLHHRSQAETRTRTKQEKKWEAVKCKESPNSFLYFCFHSFNFDASKYFSIC